VKMPPEYREENTGMGKTTPWPKDGNQDQLGADFQP